MTFIRNRSLVAAFVASSCLALPAAASADSLPSTYTSDAGQAGYVSMRTASGSTDTLPSTHRSDAAQSGYAATRTATASTLPSTHISDAAQAGYPGTPDNQPGAIRAATAEQRTVEVVRPERTIVRDVDDALPMIVSTTALLLVLAGLAVVLIRTRMTPRAGR
jgi:hypothetical protein